MDFGILNAYIDPAIDRYKGKNDDEQEEFKSTLTKFIRTYSFISNIIKLSDAQIHKFFAYAKCLLRKLPYKDGEKVNLDDEVVLQYYRVQKIFEGTIALESGIGESLLNKREAGQKKKDEEKTLLSELIEKLNERFGTEFGDMDKILEQFIADMEKDENLRMQAINNSKEHFKFPFNNIFDSVAVDRMTQNKEFCSRILDEEKFGSTIKDLLVDFVYNRLRREI